MVRLTCVLLFVCLVGFILLLRWWFVSCFCAWYWQPGCFWYPVYFDLDLSVVLDKLCFFRFGLGWFVGFFAVVDFWVRRICFAYFVPAVVG